MNHDEHQRFQPSPSLLDATRDSYREAIYRIDIEPVVEMKIGEHNADVASLLSRHHVFSAVFVTAFNPFGHVLEPAHNAKRQCLLIDHVERAGLHALPGAGIDPKGKWIAEASLFVLGTTRQFADALMQKFEQNAVVYVDAAGLPCLLWHPVYR